MHGSNTPIGSYLGLSVLPMHTSILIIIIDKSVDFVFGKTNKQTNKNADILQWIVTRISVHHQTKTYLGQANKAMVSKAQCGQQPCLWVLCGSGAGCSFSGCEVLLRRLSASERQGEEDRCGRHT